MKKVFIVVLLLNFFKLNAAIWSVGQTQNYNNPSEVVSLVNVGDTVEIEVEGPDTLHISIQDDLGRTWPRTTRLERQEAGFDSPVGQATGKYAPTG